MGGSVIKTILRVLNSGLVLKDLNYTFIVLILKKKLAVKVRDFRPISLCNMVCKLVSKVVVNRLKKSPTLSHLGIPKCLCPDEANYRQYSHRL